jgi:hypothetical protein
MNRKEPHAIQSPSRRGGVSMVAPAAHIPQHISQTKPAGVSTESPQDALDVARSLINFGCPVFVAKKNPKYDPALPTSESNPEYRHPTKWQETPPDPSLLDTWEPGDALCLVAGLGLDAVDVDSKNGANPEEVRAALDILGVDVVATAETPSGGAHYYVRSTGIRSSNNTARGIDYRGMGLDKTGAGFLYLPGTLRPKYGARGYTWKTPVNLDAVYDVTEERHGEHVDAVATFLAGIGTKIRTTAQNSADLTGAEPVDQMPEKLRDLLADISTPHGERSERFFHLVAECRRSGLTQGQTLTAVEPWCHGVGKYVGRVSEQVAHIWERVTIDRRDLTPVDLPDFVQEETEGTGEPSTWAPVDLGPILDGDYVPEVGTLMPREDGVCLLYAGRLHSFHGESESGKSLLAQGEAARLLMRGESVLFVDFESDPAAIVERLRMFGTTSEAIREHLTYVQPDTGLGSDAAREAFAEVLSRRYTLAIIDGVTEALTLVSTSNGTPEEQVVHYMRRLPRRIAKETGAAVVQIDHVTKSKDARGRYALGSQHKLNTLDGAAYMVEVTQPLAPGLRGEISLRVAKDRPGQVRRYAGKWRASDRTMEAARVVMDSTSLDHITMTVQAPSTQHGTEDGPFRPTGYMEKVSMFLETLSEPVSGRAVREAIPGKDEYVTTALDRLCMEKYVVREKGPRNSLQHKSITPYREVSDPWEVGGSVSGSGSPIRGGNTGNHSTSKAPEVTGNHSGTTREPLGTPSNTGISPGTTREPLSEKTEKTPGNHSGTTQKWEQEETW